MARTTARRSFRLKNPLVDIGAKFGSLEFSDPEKEMAFARGSGKRLAGIMQVLGLVFFVIEVGWSLPWLLSAESYSMVEVGSVSTDVARGILCLVLALTGRVHRGCGKIRSRHLEFLCAGGMVSFLFLAQLGEGHLMAPFLRNVLGLPASEVPVQGERCQVYIVLYIDGMVTVASLLPARWSSLWPVYVIAMFWFPANFLAYYGAAATFSERIYGDLGAISVVLSTLVGCSILGKRALEGQDRRQFDALIAERTLRAETEFKLSQQGSVEELATGPRSQAPTLSTADINAETGDSSDEALTTLERVATVARREQWLITPEEVSIDVSRILGKGGFGVVVEGSSFGLPVAIKISLARVQREGTHRFTSFITELRVLRKLRHPNIVLFQGAVIDPALAELALVLEMVIGPDLQGFVYKLGSAPTDRSAYSLFCGMAQALLYMHKHEPSIVHGDLKPSNVLVEFPNSEAPRAKLADFGLSRILSDHTRRLGGTLVWMAPEVMGRKNNPDTAVDSYGLGRIVLFMFSGVVPFLGWMQPAIRRALRSGDIPRTELLKGASIAARALWDIAKVCTSYCPADRPEMAAICDQLRGLSANKDIYSQLGGLVLETWGHSALKRPEVGTKINAINDSKLSTSDLKLGPVCWNRAIPQLRHMMMPQTSQADEAPPRGLAIPKHLPEEHAVREAQGPASDNAPEENAALGSPPGAGPRELPKEAVRSHSVATTAGRTPPEAKVVQRKDALQRNTVLGLPLRLGSGGLPHEE